MQKTTSKIAKLKSALRMASAISSHSIELDRGIIHNPRRTGTTTVGPLTKKTTVQIKYDERR